MMLLVIAILSGIFGFIFIRYIWQLSRFLYRLRKWKQFARNPRKWHYGVRIFSEGEMYCPITAVYKDLTGKTIPTSEAYKVYKEIGISKRLAGQIIFGADCGYSRLLRPLLMKVLNIHEFE